MADRDLRTLERTWRSSGLEADEVAFLQEALRVGELSRERMQLAASLGHAAAILALGGRPRFEVVLGTPWENHTVGLFDQEWVCRLDERPLVLGRAAAPDEPRHVAEGLSRWRFEVPAVFSGVRREHCRLWTLPDRGVQLEVARGAPVAVNREPVAVGSVRVQLADELTLGGDSGPRVLLRSRTPTCAPALELLACQVVPEDVVVDESLDLFVDQQASTMRLNHPESVFFAMRMGHVRFDSGPDPRSDAWLRLLVSLGREAVVRFALALVEAAPAQGALGMWRTQVLAAGTSWLAAGAEADAREIPAQPTSQHTNPRDYVVLSAAYFAATCTLTPPKLAVTLARLRVALDAATVWAGHGALLRTLRARLVPWALYPSA